MMPYERYFIKACYRWICENDNTPYISAFYDNSNYVLPKNDFSIFKDKHIIVGGLLFPVQYSDIRSIFGYESGEGFTLSNHWDVMEALNKLVE